MVLQDHRWYRADTWKEVPVIIGLPGFSMPEEKTRIDIFLESFSKTHHVHGLRVNWPGIEFRADKKEIVCNFDPDSYYESFAQAIEQSVTDRHVDSSRIGVISSSMSASIFADMLFNGETFHPKAYASVSPLAGWKYLATEDVRRTISENRFNIPIFNEEDQARGIQRYVPAVHLEKIASIDSLETLKACQINGMKVMTVMGTGDKVSNPDSMRNYHLALRGSPENLLEFPGGHNIPYHLYEERMKMFFKEHLRIMPRSA